MQQQTIFHLAFPVTNIAKAKTYYVDGLGCIPGRESRHALILNLHGHQIVAHLTKEPLSPQPNIYPRHFGIVFTVEQDWENLLVRAKKQELLFREDPKDRFLGSPLEHRTFFLEDPFYNLMEFKYYRHPGAIFGSAQFTQVGDRD